MTASPLERPAPYDDDERPRVGTRAGRGAVLRRRARTRQQRYAGLARFFSFAAALTFAVVLYLGLMANVTRLNYSLAKAERERASLVDATSRLDDRIARLDSREHLESVARRLGMTEPQTFLAIRVPASQPEQSTRGLAFLTWLK